MEIERVGEHAVVLSVSYERTRDCVRAIYRIRDYIRNHSHTAIVSFQPGLDSILIEYEPVPDDSFESWLENLKHVDLGNPEPIPKKMYIVPVCYDFGYDMPDISAQTGLSVEEIIQIHSSTDYQVWMIGFMPGFPYLGELPLELQLERKKNPDLMIPSGSVAIAEEYTGIYPFSSPGGWHVIGRTPWTMIDYNRQVPWTFDYGMNIRFTPISAEEFERIKQ